MNESPIFSLVAVIGSHGTLPVTIIVDTLGSGLTLATHEEHFEYSLESLGGVRIITNYIRTQKSTSEDGAERIYPRERGFSFVAVDVPNDDDRIRRNDSFASFN